jgi:tetratricopeptide (TPR) repeat protein
MMDIRATKIERFVPLGIAIVVVAAFFPVLHNGFVSLDDRRNFIDNDAFRGLGAAQLRWMWTTTLMGHYIPLSWMTLGLDYVLWGMNPAGYHLTNVVLHAANAVLLFFIARRLLRASDEEAFAGEPRRLTLAAATAALFFALHPLRVESVAWVTERRDVLSCLFFFASVLAYLRATDSAQRRGEWYWAAVGLFVCSVLSKATSMTLPAVLLILNVYPLRRVGGAVGWASTAARRVHTELVPFGVIAVGAALTSLLVLHPPAQLSVFAKVAVSAYSLVFYLWKTIVPTRLSPMYEMPQRVDPLAFRFLASYVIVAAAGFLLWIVRDKRPGLTASAVAFAIVTLPMLGIVQNGPQIAADRYTYYAAPALAIAVAGYLFAPARHVGLVASVFIAAVLAGLGVLTWNQTEMWHDSATLWTYVVRLDDNSSFAHVGLAMLAYDHGDMDGAIRHYRRAVEIRPGYDEGFNNLGNALAREGKLDDAVEQYRHALSLNRAFPEAHNDLGSALAQQGRIPDAIEQYREALALRPDYAEAHNNWGAALAREGDLTSAIEHYARAIAIDSSYADAYNNWGNALVKLGKPGLAESRYEAALRLQPDNADVHRNLGVAMAQQGRMAEAADQFRLALASRPDDEDVKAYLAEATKAASVQGKPPR